MTFREVFPLAKCDYSTIKFVAPDFVGEEASALKKVLGVKGLGIKIFPAQDFLVSGFGGFCEVTKLKKHQLIQVLTENPRK